MSARFLRRLPGLGRFFGSPRGRELTDRFFEGIPERFFHNVGWQYGGAAAASVIGFFYTLLVARALGVTQFGLMSLGLAFAAIVSQLANVRVRDMVIRYVARFQGEGDLPRVLATAKLALLLDAGCGAAALAVLFALAPWAAAHLVRDPLGPAVIALSGLAFIFQNVANDTAIGLLRLLSKFKTLALMEVAAALFKLAAALAVIWGLGWGVLGVLAVLLVTNLLANLALLGAALWYLGRRIPLRSPAPLSLLRPHRRDLGRFVFHNYLTSLSSFAGGDLDINLLGFFSSKDAVGIYKVARSFIVALWQLSDAAFLVVYPEIARLWMQADFVRLKRFLKRLALVMAASGLLLYSAAFFVVPWLIHGLMRSEFADAGVLFRCMGWGIILWSPLIWVGPLLISAGRTDLLFRSALAGSITMLLLYCAAIPRLGALGAALVYAVNNATFVAFALWHARRAGLLFPPAATPPASQRAPGPDAVRGGW